MSGEQLPNHIIDAISNYYETPAESRNAPLTSVPQQPGMQNQPQKSLRDVLSALNSSAPGGMPQGRPMPTSPYGTMQQGQGFPYMNRQSGAFQGQQQGNPMPQRGSPITPGTNYGPLQ